MKVKVRFRGPISLVTGPKLLVELPRDAKIRDLAEKLRRDYGEKARETGLEQVLLHFESQNLIIVDDREISALQGMETSFGDESIIKVVNFTRGE